MKWLKRFWEFATSKSVAFVLAAAGFSVAIYSVWFYHAHPAITFDVISDTKVLDIHETIGSLDVTYGGQSLKNSNKELRVLQIKITNSGRADITKDAFDSSDPFGFRIPGGEILEPPHIFGSSPYLSLRATLKEPNASTVLVAPIILESGEWMQLKLLVAVPAGDTANIQPIGKIAGIRTANVVDVSREISNQSFWSRVAHSDDWTIRILLAPAWFIAFFLLLAFAILILAGVVATFGVPLGKVRDISVRKHRIRVIETYKKTRTLCPSDHFVVDEYYKRGRAAIPSLNVYLTAIEKHNSDLKDIRAMQAQLAAAFPKEIIEHNVRFRDVDQNRIFGEVHLPHAIPADVDIQLRSSVGDHLSIREAKVRGIETDVDGFINVSADLAPAIKHFSEFLLMNGQGPLDGDSTAKERTLD